MDKIWKEIWLDALRSGDYEQGRGLMCEQKFAYFQLPADNQHSQSRDKKLTFCCLGVLRHTATGVENFRDAQAMDMNFSSTQLTKREAEYFDITNDQQNVLINLNDGKQWNFTNIAKWIEVNL